ncbi:uncharacterized protein KY384_000630 [Bacidia gigantensis]|uniref:uncharacterized protein n=1 Tax=Bacidia gigantensis TaxID=2732470 RepID=UPI001D0375D6|nr:uncharacterized protein KY384_000630 [Bacidia gigantensis]KAG8525870.1 hypothetical protein KY384_000630 [Bacidia gigantensis]
MGVCTMESDSENESHDEIEIEQEADGDNTGADDDRIDEEADPEPGTSEQGRATEPKGSALPILRPETVQASVYDIVPTIAAPQSTSINAVTSTPDLRFVFSGGSDGYIRKFNWVETANGKSMLTVAQRHPFVDSVTKAGVLTSYWENADPSTVSAVYCLAVQREALWLLSGLEGGGINLQAVRHDEGKRIALLRGHTSAISALNLATDEQSCLSGSWDKTVLDWDLNTGKTIRSFDRSTGQISALERRPFSSLPVPQVSGNMQESGFDELSNNASKPRANSVNVEGSVKDEAVDAEKSPADSLFDADADSLFGNDDNVGGSGVPFDDDDNDFSRAIASDLQERQQVEILEGQGENIKEESLNSVPTQNGEPILINGTAANQESLYGHETLLEASQHLGSELPTDGLPHAEQTVKPEELSVTPAPAEISIDAETTFLAASFDGSLRIWDKRQQVPVATMMPHNVPPWCMGACFSSDGNFIYAGRRNSSVDEYSLHMGLQRPSRNFKLPNNSGPVSAVRAMPNGRHLICTLFATEQLIAEALTMPEYMGLNVNVVVEDEELKEWGTQYLNKSRKVSSYVESRTDQKFHISIQPQVPTFTLPPSLQSRPLDQAIVAGSTRLLATLYLDNRKVPAKRSVVYLDEGHPDANEGCKVCIKSRWIKTASGAFKEHSWVFKERSVDALLGIVDLDLNEDTLRNESDEDVLTKALEAAASLDTHLETSKASGKVGQIVVEFSRVTLGSSYVDTLHRSHYDYNGAGEVDPSRDNRDIVHTAGLVTNNIESRHLSRVVDVHPYARDDGPFATFQFFYRTKEQLAKYGFPGLSGLTPTSRQSQKLDSRLIDFVPLSFSQHKPLTLAKAVQSFEASIANNSLLKGSQPESTLKPECREFQNTSLKTDSEQIDTRKPGKELGQMERDREKPQEPNSNVRATQKTPDQTFSHYITQSTEEEKELSLASAKISSPWKTNPTSQSESSRVSPQDHPNNQPSFQNLPNSTTFRDSQPDMEYQDKASEDNTVPCTDFDADEIDATDYPANPEEAEETYTHIRNRLQNVVLGKRNRDKSENGGNIDQSLQDAAISKLSDVSQLPGASAIKGSDGGGEAAEKRVKTGEVMDNVRESNAS